MSWAVDCVWNPRAILGEGPVWVGSQQALLFVDIEGARLFRYRPGDGQVQAWPLKEACCWLIERADGDGFLAGFRRRIVHLRLTNAGPTVVAEVARPEAHLPGNRFNDAKADRQGRVWAGTMDDAEHAVSGALYRISDDRVDQIDSQYGIANGPAVSPDGGTLYHTDTAIRTIYAFDCSPEGELSRKRVHIRLAIHEGYPDGMTCDAQGGLWVAHFGGGCLSRFHPDGRFDTRVPIPASQVTSCTFGDEKLDALYVTTAMRGREAEPLAGGLFRVPVKIPGLPANRYTPLTLKEKTR